MTATPDVPRVAVLILTWNRVDELVPCLESFACNALPEHHGGRDRQRLGGREPRDREARLPVGRR